jgi:hypothetical protein
MIPAQSINTDWRNQPIMTCQVGHCPLSHPFQTQLPLAGTPTDQIKLASLVIKQRTGHIAGMGRNAPAQERSPAARCVRTMTVGLCGTPYGTSRLRSPCAAVPVCFPRSSPYSAASHRRDDDGGPAAANRPSLREYMCVSHTWQMTAIAFAARFALWRLVQGYAAGFVSRAS